MIMKNPIFVLASKSPRRKELLTNIGINPHIVPANVDESAYRNLKPQDMVRTLAMLKATDVAKSLSGDMLVIGADTCVCADGVVLGKPQTSEEALDMLMLLSGKTHEVHTGYCVCSAAMNASARCETTRVTFGDISKEEALAYIKTREPMDKAGGYGIQKKGALLIKKIEGDYFNVVGLPLFALKKMLKEDFGVDLL